MEIACDILRRSSISDRHKDIRKKFKELKLSDICRKSSYSSFYKLINNEKYINTTMSLIEQYVDNVDTEFSLSILMAYCISAYPDNLFDTFRSRFEQKLILAANKVVLYLEKLITESELSSDFHDEFLNIMDHYYSLYKLWKSRDSINQMSIVFDEMKEAINIYRLQLKRNYTLTNYDSIYLSLNELFNQNPKYATRILLHNYDIVRVIDAVEIKFWDKVREAYSRDKDAIFIIMVAELRIKLIPMLTNPIDRKELYYTIDTEEIINKVRAYDFTQDKIKKIMNTLQSKVAIVNPNYIKGETLKYADDIIIRIFNYMFNTTYDVIKNT
ncbi:hypothetical protein QKU48_gp0650 [Fadolivirus algeromassiliense]|jgi:hypothetical protein|uniref:Uncharacterized protein n=1 Tax=Fadolivirus FV1/VV64 TaxID=3070911 RepID=A0A7D3UPQ3_9VIRU|nr:hypothetical protein QKU48_gp0650 [Fadolivirus algeromassiliense]QKF94108.1 hypothetical protein Fadolivirus_1_650 [Fadolivirus FV1/VV64]